MPVTDARDGCQPLPATFRTTGRWDEPDYGPGRGSPAPVAAHGLGAALAAVPGVPDRRPGADAPAGPRRRHRGGRAPRLHGGLPERLPPHVRWRALLPLAASGAAGRCGSPGGALVLVRSRLGRPDDLRVRGCGGRSPGTLGLAGSGRVSGGLRRRAGRARPAPHRLLPSVPLSADRLRTSRDAAPHLGQRRTGRGPRGAGPQRRRRGAAALRPRPPRPAGPQPVADRAQERARRPAGGARPGPGPAGDGRRRGRRAAGAGRGPRRGERLPGGQPRPGPRRGAVGAVRGRHHAAGAGRREAAAGRGGRCPRVGGPGGHHERAAAQRSAFGRRGPVGGGRPHPARRHRRRSRRRRAAGDRPGGPGRAGRGPRWPARRRTGRRSRLPAQRGRAHAAAREGGRPVIRVLIAEDQTLVRGALRALLELEEDLEVVAEVGRGDAVVPAAVEHRPDVALLDIEMPGGDGIEAARDLAAALPACRAVILTTFGRPGFLRRAMEVGAAGFLVKDAPVAELARGIRAVMAGERVIDRDLAAAALAIGATPLSAREADVLRAAAGGATVADIAARLFLSEGTVRNYLSSAIGKTGARTRVEAARVAEEKGWL